MRKADAIALVVADETELRETLVDFLRGLGLIAIPASDGESARVIVRKVRLDLVLFDVPSPEMIAVSPIYDCKRRRPDAAIIALSGLSPPYLERELRLLGADAVLYKPVSLVELEEAVSRLLSLEARS